MATVVIAYAADLYVDRSSLMNNKVASRRWTTTPVANPALGGM